MLIDQKIFMKFRKFFECHVIGQMNRSAPIGGFNFKSK